MSKNKHVGWIDYSINPDSDRLVLLTDGDDIQVGHFYAAEKRYLGTDLKTIRYWMDIPTPPRQNDSLKHSYSFYKACRSLVSNFKDKDLDSISLGLIEHAEVILRVYDGVYSKFYDDWLKDKAAYKTGYLGIPVPGNGTIKSWVE